jgi:hypothetical protein
MGVRPSNNGAQAARVMPDCMTFWISSHFTWKAATHWGSKWDPLQAMISA